MLALLQQAQYLGFVVLAAYAVGWGAGGLALAAACLVASLLPLARLLDYPGGESAAGTWGAASVAWGALLAVGLGSPLVAGGALVSALG